MFYKRISTNKKLSKISNNPLKFFSEKHTLCFTEDIEGLNYSLFKQAQTQGKKFLRLTLRNSQDLSRLEKITSISNGNISISDGPLLEIIQKGGILLIDYERSNPKIAESLNSLFDDHAKYKGLKAHKNLQIIGALNDVTDYYAASFYSRFKNILELNFQRSQPDIKETAKKLKNHCELYYSENWQEELLGGYSIDKDGKPQANEGILINALRNDQPLSLSGFDWNNPECQRFINELFDRGYIYFNGEKFNISENFYLAKYTNIVDYSTNVINKKITNYSEAKAKHKPWAINDKNIDLLFSLTSVTDGKLIQNKGLLEQDKLTLRITSNIPEWVWHRIMHSSAEIKIEVSESINIPNIYKKFSEKIISCNQKSKSLKEAISEKVIYISSLDEHLTKKLLEKELSGEPIETYYINPKTKTADFLTDINLTDNKKSEFSFAEEEQDIYRSLQEGKTVVLSDLANNIQLRQELASLFVPDPYLIITGKRVDLDKLKGKIIVIDSSGQPEHTENFVDLSFSQNRAQYKQKIKDILLVEFPSLGKGDLELLLGLDQIFETIPTPVDNEYPSSIDFSLSRLRNVLKQLDFSGTRISPAAWYRAISNVFIEEYNDVPEVAAFLKVMTRRQFGVEKQTKNTINYKELKIVLNNIVAPVKLDGYFWQLMNTLSGDILLKIELGDNFQIKDFPKNTGLDVIKKTLIKNADGDWKKFYEHKYGKYTDISMPAKYYNPITIEDERSWEHRFNKCKKILEKFPTLFLKGSPGVGKSYVCAELATELGYQENEIFGAITTGSDTPQTDILGRKTLNNEKKHTEFLETEFTRFARANKGIIFIDESNLPQEGFWDFMKGLFEQKPFVYINGKKISLSKEHKVIFTGNQDRLPGRTVHKVVREHFITVMFPEFDEQFIYQKMYDDYLQRNETLPKEKLQEIATVLFEMHSFVKKIAPENTYTLRDVQELCRRVTKKGFKPRNAALAINSVYGGQLSAEQKLALKKMIFMKYGIDITEELTISRNDKTMQETIKNISSKSSEHQLIINEASLMIVEAVANMLKARRKDIDSNKNGIGKNGLIFEGPSGRGKDAVLAATLEASGYIEYEEFQKISLTDQKKYLEEKKVYFHLNASPDCDPLFEKVELAKKEGLLVIISEANLLPSAILEGRLNDSLTGKSTIGFGIFMTINSVNYSGREKFSTALINRTIYHKLADYSQAEFSELAKKQNYPHVSEEQISLLVNFHCWLRDALFEKRSTIIPTTREILKTLKLINKGISVDHALQQIYAPLYLKRVLKLELVPEKEAYQSFKEKNKPDKIEALKIQGIAMTPKKHKEFSLYSFDPSKNTKYKNMTGVYFEDDNSYTFNKQISEDEMYEKFIHELGHSIYTRNFEKDTVSNSLQHWLEDFRQINALKKTYPHIPIREKQINYFALIIKTITKENNFGYLKTLIETDPKDLFKIILAAYGLNLIEKKDIEFLADRFSNNKTLAKTIGKTLKLLLKKDRKDKDSLDKAKNVINYIPTNHNLEEERDFYAFLANREITLINKTFREVPDNINRINKNNLDKVSALEKNNKKYKKLSDKENLALYQKTNTVKTTKENLLKEFKKQRISLEKTKEATARKVAPPKSKKTKQQTNDFLLEIRPRILKELNKITSQLSYQKGYFEKEYGQQGVLDFLYFLTVDPVNARLKSGLIENREKKEIILSEKITLTTWTPIVEDMFELLLQQGFKISVYIGDNKFVDGKDIKDLATLKATMAMGYTEEIPPEISKNPTKHVTTIDNLRSIFEEEYIYQLISNLLDSKEQNQKINSLENIQTAKSTTAAIEVIAKILNISMEEVNKRIIIDINTDQITGLNLSGINNADQKIKEIFLSCRKKLYYLESLNLGNTDITDKIISELKTLSSSSLAYMENLWLNDTWITEKIIESLRSISSLRYINIKNLQISSETAYNLQKYFKKIHKKKIIIEGINKLTFQENNKNITHTTDETPEFIFIKDVLNSILMQEQVIENLKKRFNTENNQKAVELLNKLLTGR